MTKTEERIAYARECLRKCIVEGYECGPACLKTLADTYEISLSQALKWESLTFSQGAGVYDRCAAFQAAATIIGIWYGRTSPKVRRTRYREDMGILSETFYRKLGSYRCKDFEECKDNCDYQKIEPMIQTAVEALEQIRERERERMNERLDKFKVHERIRKCAPYFMDEEDWKFVDDADETGNIPVEKYKVEDLEKAYKKGIINKKPNEDGTISYILGTFHKRIDCMLRGENERFENLPEDIRSTIVEYEQAADLWILPRRKEGVNMGALHPVPLEDVLAYIDTLEDRLFYVQMCDCKAYRRDNNHMRETCLHYIKKEELLNSNLDRGYGKILTKNEVKQLLIATDKDGLIHNCGPTFCCNCCDSCWTMHGFRTYEKLGFPAYQEYVKRTYVMHADPEKCVGCNQCTSICPAGVMSLENGKIHINQERCFGCGVCRSRCAVGALTLQKL